jgi:hypothetical protein
MSVKDRIEDSKLLLHAGRLEGSLISVLLAVAATSRKRYPPSAGMRDRAAFVQFLTDERPKITGGMEINIEFCGQTLSLENLLYKFVRNSLIHEGQLEKHVSFEYGDFLFDKRGTTDFFTFSSELVLHLAFAVETAPENNGLYPADKYERLPEPTDLKQLAAVTFRCGGQTFDAYCWAASVRTEVWEDTGEETTWLHLKGRQVFNGQMTDKPSLTLLVPTKYVTSIKPGPALQRTRRRTSEGIGLFPPDQPSSADAMSLPAIMEAVSKLQIAVVETTITVRRPHYEVAGLRDGASKT